MTHGVGAPTPGQGASAHIGQVSDIFDVLYEQLGLEDGKPSV